MTGTDDYSFMAQALRLAEKGLFTTTPNPRVGCVLVKEGQVIGAGWHEKAGEAHAEIHALRDAAAKVGAGGTAQGMAGMVEVAGPAAYAGCTAYVTLEPCSHHGRTPPCAEALIGAGVTRVVCAMQDPNPLVAGRGLEMLRAAGLRVDCGVLEADARELNIGFVSRMTRGRPWLRLKVATSLDGKTALKNGRSQWITGPDARRDVHAWRARSCAMLTGIGTVKDDNPRLTVRNIETTRQPLRVVVDSRLEISPAAAILEGGRCLIATAQDHPEKRAQLAGLGVDVVVLANAAGKVDLPALLQELGRRGINEVMVEAGAKLNGSLLREGCVDELLLYQAPLLLGDAARGLADVGELTDLAAAPRWQVVDRRTVGADFFIRARAG